MKIYIIRAYSGLASYSENTFFDGFDKNSLKILISYGCEAHYSNTSESHENFRINYFRCSQFNSEIVESI